jgi:hypothetical protein
MGNRWVINISELVWLLTLYVQTDLDNRHKNSAQENLNFKLNPYIKIYNKGERIDRRTFV